MADFTTTANQITGWAALGVPLPKNLTDLTALLEEVRWADTTSVVRADITKLSRKSIDSTIEALAVRIATDEHRDRAKNLVVQELSRDIVKAASDAVPSIIKAIEPRFTTEAARFAAAVAELPDELSSDSLVAAGPQALVALAEARDAARYLHLLDGWVAGLVDLPSHAGVATEPVLRILAPANRSELKHLLTAHSAPKSPLLAELGAVLVEAVRLGIPFKISTPRESAAIREAVESVPVERKTSFTRF